MRAGTAAAIVVVVWSSLVFWLSVTSIAACGVAGRLGVELRRARRKYRDAVEQRTWLMAKEREIAAQTAVDEERARIARELHDIVSHNVSMMLIQAGAARQVLAASAAASTSMTASARDAGAAEGALLAVESAGRATMTELRHLLGVLAPAQDGVDDYLAPQPTMTRLSPLIDRIAFAGLPVEIRIAGEPRPLPAGVDATAYRIIQEALTNALKHGDGGTAEVTVRYDDRYLRIEVLTAGRARATLPARALAVGTLSAGALPAGALPGGALAAGDGQPAVADDAPTRSASARQGVGTGRGLLGLRERVAVYGGDLDARRRLGGGFRVRARIPLDAP
jgi:signal transduction histidine kinase